uniref:RNF14 n=1 Tax=Plectus sambesii TaxID=2011161 RepID=A0A914VL04_9BILA
MDSLSAQNADEQNSEILALESIYDTDKFATDRTKDGRLRGKITIEVPMTTKMTLTAAVGTKRKTVQVENLSPVYLEFVLPNDYPSTSPPEVSLSAAWLDSSMSAELLKRLNEFWTENAGMPVLYSWSQVVQDEAATLMNASELDLDHIAASQMRSKRRISIDQSLTTASGDGDLPSSSSATLTGEQRLSLICDYDELVRRRQFETGWYQCNVCLSEKAGRHSLEFYPCGHVFCIDCVNGYFSVQIKDGAVRQLHCMEDKCKSEATPQQVRLAVPAELYERYERLLLSQTLDLMTDIVVCPRPQCQ